MPRQPSRILTDADTSDLEKQIAVQEKIVKQETDKLKKLTSRHAKLTQSTRSAPDASQPTHSE